MKKSDYSSFILIGIGLYFFLIQLDYPIIQRLNTWTTLIVGIGLWLLFIYVKTKNIHLLVQGLTVLFIGIHFYGMNHIQHWIHHWAMFPLALGLALVITYMLTRRYLLQSIVLIGLSLLFIFSKKLPSWFPSLTPIENEVRTHWPLILIGLGIVCYFYKKK